MRIKSNIIARISILMVCISLFTILEGCNATDNDTVTNKSCIKDEWRFSIIDEKRVAESEIVSPTFDDSDWEKVTLPHTAHIEPLLVNDQWQGICYYRKRIDTSTLDSKENKYFVEFEAAMNILTIWINGKQVITDQGGYLPTVFDITPYVDSEEIVLVAKLDNRDNPVTGPKPLKILDFCTYGGIYRNAYLIAKKRLYITNSSYANVVAGGGIFISYPKVSTESSIVNIKTHVANEYDKTQKFSVECQIVDKEGVVASSSSEVYKLCAGNSVEVDMPITVTDAKLWSPDSPNLYTAVVKVKRGETVTDTEKVEFGIRNFKFVENQLYINGKKHFLRGVNRHQEYPFVGYAISDNAQYRDAYLIKQAGFDYVRLSHYPQSPAFMQACDRLGIVVIDAILGWQYYSDTDAFREQIYNSAHRLVRRDRNHPCVLAWEVSLNETDMPKFFMDKLHQIVQKEYPYSGAYTAGWKFGSYDIFFQARQHRILHSKEVTFEKPYIVSEYGDWEYYSTNAGLNQHNHSQEMRLELSSRQHRRNGEKALLQQAYNVQEAHNDNLNTPAFADGYWVMFDYNRGYHNDLEASGIMDIFRIPKFSYYFYRSQQESQPMLKIATYWNDESSNNVKIYSNCDSVSLMHNGKLIATQTPDNDSISTNLTHPPFTFAVNNYDQKGTLEATGYINGVAVAKDCVTSAKLPAKLIAEVAENGCPAQSGCEDILFVYIKAVDEQGSLCPSYNQEITVSLPQGVTLINEEAIKAEAGIATLLIKIGNKYGELKGSATSADGLKGTITIDVKHNKKTY